MNDLFFVYVLFAVAIFVFLRPTKLWELILYKIDNIIERLEPRSPPNFSTALQASIYGGLLAPHVEANLRHGIRSTPGIRFLNWIIKDSWGGDGVCLRVRDIDALQRFVAANMAMIISERKQAVGAVVLVKVTPHHLAGLHQRAWHQYITLPEEEQSTSVGRRALAAASDIDEFIQTYRCWFRFCQLSKTWQKLDDNWDDARNYDDLVPDYEALAIGNEVATIGTEAAQTYFTRFCSESEMFIRSHPDLAHFFEP